MRSLCCGSVCILIAGSASALTLLCVDVNGMFLLGGLGTQRLYLARHCYFLDTDWTHLIHDRMEEPGCVHRQDNKRRKTSVWARNCCCNLLPHAGHRYYTWYGAGGFIDTSNKSQSGCTPERARAATLCSCVCLSDLSSHVITSSVVC